MPKLPLSTAYLLVSHKDLSLDLFITSLCTPLLLAIFFDNTVCLIAGMLMIHSTIYHFVPRIMQAGLELAKSSIEQCITATKNEMRSNFL